MTLPITFEKYLEQLTHCFYDRKSFHLARYEIFFTGKF